MSPEDLGFVWDDTNEYWYHLFGNKGMEIALEPYGAGRFYLALYQNRRLLAPKRECLVNPTGMVLVFPRNDFQASEADKVKQHETHKLR